MPCYQDWQWIQRHILLFLIVYPSNLQPAKHEFQIKQEKCNILFRLNNKHSTKFECNRRPTFSQKISKRVKSYIILPAWLGSYDAAVKDNVYPFVTLFLFNPNKNSIETKITRPNTKIIQKNTSRKIHTHTHTNDLVLKDTRRALTYLKIKKLHTQ